MDCERIKTRTTLRNKRHRCCSKDESNIEFIEYKDGAVAFSDPDVEEGFIYLYPEQLIQLKLRLSTRDIEQLREQMQTRKLKETRTREVMTRGFQHA